MSPTSDGTRSVGYVYDANGNLVTFTDATAKNTTFQYDQPGRMTKFFLPATNPWPPGVAGSRRATIDLSHGSLPCPFPAILSRDREVASGGALPWPGSA